MGIKGLNEAKLGAVDWAQIEDAYCPATGIPTLLEASTQEDAKARKKALADLDNRIAHQGFAIDSGVSFEVVIAQKLVGERLIRVWAEEYPRYGTRPGRFSATRPTKSAGRRVCGVRNA